MFLWSDFSPTSYFKELVLLAKWEKKKKRNTDLCVPSVLAPTSFAFGPAPAVLHIDVCTEQNLMFRGQ